MRSKVKRQREKQWKECPYKRCVNKKYIWLFFFLVLWRRGLPRRCSLDFSRERKRASDVTHIVCEYPPSPHLYSLTLHPSSSSHLYFSLSHIFLGAQFLPSWDNHKFSPTCELGDTAPPSSSVSPPSGSPSIPSNPRDTQWSSCKPLSSFFSVEQQWNSQCSVMKPFAAAALPATAIILLPSTNGSREVGRGGTQCVCKGKKEVEML